MQMLELTGIDGSSPIGFLAALGILDVVSAARASRPQMSWQGDDTYRPVIRTDMSREDLVDAILADRNALDKAAWLCDENQGSKPAFDMKVAPSALKAYLRQVVASSDIRLIRLVAGFASEAVTDNNGKTKPTALHFTAGKQFLLSTVKKLGAGLVKNDVEEALFGPWRYTKRIEATRWDPTLIRERAYRALSPSKESVFGVPGAEWLAFRGLAMLPVAPRGTKLVTTGVCGHWKQSYFRWPLWNGWLSRDVLVSLLTSRETFTAPHGAVARARGITTVFESYINRTKYGSFGPASIASVCIQSSIKRLHPHEHDGPADDRDQPYSRRARKTSL